MRALKWRLERIVSCFLLSAAAACLASGSANATCTNTTGAVTCYIKVQPIDVCPNGDMSSCAPFNTVSSTGYPDGSTSQQTPPNLPQAGYPPQTLTRQTAPLELNGAQVSNNTISTNPIGFVVDPATGCFPGQACYPGTGVDVTRKLLNNMGIELVWIYPMGVSTANYSTLDVKLASTTTAVASCSGYISNTTLTITSSCTFPGTANPAYLAVYVFLSSGTTIASGTFITAFGTGAGGKGTYTFNLSQTAGSSKKPITITANSFILTSSDLQ